MQDTPKEAATGDKAARDLMLSELLQVCTPAPWKAVTNSWDISSIYSESKQCIATCPIGYFWGDALQEQFEFEKDANAKLIALAPTIAAELIKERAVNAKLLEALNRIVDWQLRPMESGVPAQKGVTDMQLHQARLAIKQAEEL